MEPEVLDHPQDTQEPTLRETIEEAITSSEDESGAESGKTSAPASAKVESPSGAQEPAPHKQPEGAKPAPTAEAPTTPTDKPVPTQDLKAPAQWKPHVREKWGQLPREVQEEILRREGDSMRLIGSVGPKIRMADEVNNHLQPFTERLQANGVNTSEFLGDVFTTIKSLTEGDDRTKAEVVANIIQSYRIDLQALDTVLAGRLSGPPPDPRLLEAQRRAMAAESMLAKQRQTLEEQTQERLGEQLQQFSADPKNEFFEDVRELMADLIETGRATSLEDAYAAAVWANPDTRKILLQREAEARVAAKQNRAGAARRASSSVAGAPRAAGMAPTNQQNMSLRETIAAAMDAQDAA
jgi:hypothetical protein